MAKKEKVRFSPPALGGSSLLVVFAVLCLTVFALLSLSTVRADSRLGDTAAQAVAGYYAADSQAEEILAQLRAGQVPKGVEESGGIYRYSCPISEGQRLEVEVTLTETRWQVLKWQAVSTEEWTPRDHVELYEGDGSGLG